MVRNLTIVLSISMLSITLIAFASGCSKADNDQQMQTAKHQHEGMNATYHGKVDQEGKAKGATMGTIFTSDSLYTCPMHPEVVTDNPKARCPLCGMNLEKMSGTSKTALLDSHPKGCSMDPIVVQGDSETNRCPICKMKLQEISKDHEIEQQH